MNKNYEQVDIKEIEHPEDNIIRTIGDLVSYLQTLDQDKILACEYINIQLGKYVGIKERPFLKSLIKNDSDKYTLIAMFY